MRTARKCRACPAPELQAQLGRTFECVRLVWTKALSRHLQRKATNLARHQRRTARKTQGSNNRRKARRKVAVAHRKVRHAHNDFLHKTSTRLVRDHDLIGTSTRPRTSLRLVESQPAVRVRPDPRCAVLAKPAQ